MKSTLVFTLIAMFSLSAFAQDEKDVKPDSAFGFQILKELKTTPVKNQSRTGTCWSFASVSFLESEILRNGGPEVDLSEMFIVHHNYKAKADKYVRMQGSSNFGEGSLAQDALRVLRVYGLMPEGLYSGFIVDPDEHNHAELQSVLKAMLDAIIRNRGGELSPVWKEAYNKVLSTYLGVIPEKFEWEGKTYTPNTFARSLDLKAGDYIEFTSFTHHPFYQNVAVEIPDNWAGNPSVNIPLDELMAVMTHAIENGFTVLWDGDVSEKSFDQKKGIATLPSKEWADRNDDEKDHFLTEPEPEIEVTQDYRQRLFDNYRTTDDHLMHVTGSAKDKQGTRYFITKNSWGTRDKGPYEGYIYLSEAYIKAKTVTILVHKDAVPQSVRSKLRL